jgi:hypothetical protein
MNRLRIVVEDTGEVDELGEPICEVLYCGSNRTAAEQALHAPSSKDRALFVKPSVSQYNRPTLAKAAPAAVIPDEPKAAYQYKPVTTKKK